MSNQSARPGATIDVQTLENIVHSGPTVAILWETVDRWPVSFISDNVDQFGYQPEDFYSEKVSYADLIYPGDLKTVEAALRNALQKGDEKLYQRYRIVNKGGNIRWVDDWTTLFGDQQWEKLKAQSTILDVTDAIQAEALALNFARFPRENPNPILSVDRSGDVLLANDATQSLLLQITNGASTDRESWKNLLSTSVKLTKRRQLNLDIANKTFLFDIIPSMNEHTNLYGFDISYQKEQEQRLGDIADNLPGAIWQYSVMPQGQHRITFLNRRCEEIWEMSSEELGDDPTPLWQMVVEEDLPGLRNSVDEAVNTLSHWHFEYRICTPSGKMKWLSSVGTPYRSANGDVHFDTIAIDQTDQKLAAEKLASALRSTIDVLSSAVEIRDPYTAGHEEKVAKIASLIGARLGLDVNRLTGLNLAARIHDVGKIQIPSEILNKPGRLSDIEYALIKQHPEAGADLLNKVSFEWPVADMIRQHHERMDGSGYPFGLKGEEILLEARIIGVADVVEAIASHRPYRAALGMEVAIDEIRQGMGSRYDSSVAKACLELIESGDITLS